MKKVSFDGKVTLFMCPVLFSGSKSTQSSNNVTIRFSVFFSEILLAVSN